MKQTRQAVSGGCWAELGRQGGWCWVGRLGTELGLLATRVEIDFRRDGTGHAHGNAHGNAHHALCCRGPCAHASPPGPLPCVPGRLYRETRHSQSVWDERALYNNIGISIGIGHQHHSPAQMLQPSCGHGHGRCSAPQTFQTDLFQALNGRPSHPVPSQTPGTPMSKRCSQYVVSTVSRNSTINARLLCPGINSCTHTITPQHTCQALSPPPPSLHPPMYSVPSTMLRGRGWRSGGLDSLMQHHSTVHTTVSCCSVYRTGPAPSPTFCI